MGRDYYVVLGVSRDADLEAIRRAYRALVKRYHPDAGGIEPERFHELQRAYETLSDAHSRQAYDRQVGRPLVTPRQAPAAPRAARLVPAAAPEPLLFDLVDELVGGFVPGIFVTGRQASRRKDLYVELILSPDEAARGGLFTLDLPVREPCPTCWGGGVVAGAACPQCGDAITHHELRLSVPPRVADQTRVQVPLDGIGLPEILLNVLVTIEP